MNAPITTTTVREIKGLIADKWPTFWTKLAQETTKGKTPRWEAQFEDLAARLGPDAVFDGLYQALKWWDRSDRPPLAIEVADFMGHKVSPVVAKHLHLPWNPIPEQGERGTDDERAKFLEDWKKAASGSPADALGEYSRAVASGFTGSMREYWKR